MIVARSGDDAARRLCPRPCVLLGDELGYRHRTFFPNVEVRQGLIEDLPVESDSVDWVVSNCVINLSPEKERVFREIARVLRPGGRYVILVFSRPPFFLFRPVGMRR